MPVDSAASALPIYDIPVWVHKCSLVIPEIWKATYRDHPAIYLAMYRYQRGFPRSDG